ncbi:MAG: hypothetical protein ACYC4M_03680, partial [Thermoleophilia bacterium]
AQIGENSFDFPAGCSVFNKDLVCNRPCTAPEFVGGDVLFKVIIWSCESIFNLIGWVILVSFSKEREELV